MASFAEGSPPFSAMRQFLFNPQIVLSTTNLGGREGEVATPSFPIEIPSGNSFLYSLGLILGLHKPDLLIFQLHHKRDQRPAHTFWHLEKQAQVPGPHPGDHSHRPPPGWVGGNNKHTLQLSMHTSSTNLAAAISTSSTGTITSILHKRDLSTQRLPCPRNINTLHPRTRPLREKGCLCPSPTKPKTTTPLLTRFDSRITQTGPTHIPTTPQKGSAPSSYFLASGETGTGARPTPRGSQSSTAPSFSLGSPNSNRKQQPNKHHKPNTITRR